jgi:hypothetical protein
MWLPSRENSMAQSIHKHCFFGAKRTLPLLALIGLLLFACSDESPKFPSAVGKPTPYVLKEDCKFTIVEKLSRAGITSPKVEGMPGATGSASISLGAKSITVSDCTVTANSHSLPIYQK